MSRNFNGTTQYGANTSISLDTYPTTTGWTVAGWFRFTGSPGPRDMFSVETAAGTEWIYGRLHTDLRLRMSVLEGSSGYTTNYATADTWQHVAVIETSSTSRRIVLNGDWANSATVGDSLAWGADVARFSLGTLYANGNFYTYWSGLLAHFAVWNTPLSQSEVEGLAAGDNPLAVQNSNLLAYWPLAGTASPEPDDKNAYDLTLYNTPTQGASDPTVDAPPGTSGLMGARCL